MPRKTSDALQNFEALTDVPRSSLDWVGVIEDQRLKLKAAEASEAQLLSDDADLLLSFRPDAEAEAIARADQLRHARERIEFLKRAIARAEQKRDEAAELEHADVLDRQTADAQIHAQAAIELRAAIDEKLRELGQLVRELGDHYRELLRPSLQGVHGVAAHRFHNLHALRGAIWKNGGADLAHFFEAPAMSPDHRRSLADRERRKWAPLLACETKAGARRARIDGAGPERVAKIEAELLDQHPALIVNGDTDSPDAIHAKAERLDALISERLEAAE